LRQIFGATTTSADADASCVSLRFFDRHAAARDEGRCEI
jgi:hypothetical protein